MVGVPGRSKGCHTCRRRKKGCDLARPQCARCRQAGLKCEGYERVRVFVHTGPVALLPRPKGVPVAETRSEGSSAAAYSLDLSLPPSLSQAAYRTKCVSALWEMYPGGGHHHSQCACEVSTVGWITDIHNTPLFQKNLALQKSVLALSLATIGRRDEREWMVQHGLRLYGAAVRSLSMEMARVSRLTPPSDAMIATTRVLALFELFSGGILSKSRQADHGHAWYTHRMGELALLSARAPETCIEGHGHNMFIDGRYVCTVAATLSRRPTVLSRPEWKNIPWSKREKTPKDLLVDVFVHIPSLLHEYDTANNCTDPVGRKTLMDQCIQSCELFEREVLDWLEASAPSGWATNDCPPAPARETPTADTIAGAHTMCLFWAVRILILTTSFDAFRCVTGAPPPSAMGKTKPDSRLITTLFCCRAIARTAPLFFTPQGELMSCSQIATFSMSVALQGLVIADGPIPSEDQTRLLDLFRAPAKGGGTLAQFVGSLLKHAATSHANGAAEALARLSLA